MIGVDGHQVLLDQGLHLQAFLFGLSQSLTGDLQLHLRMDAIFVKPLAQLKQLQDKLTCIVAFNQRLRGFLFFSNFLSIFIGHAEQPLFAGLQLFKVFTRSLDPLLIQSHDVLGLVGKHTPAFPGLHRHTSNFMRFIFMPLVSSIDASLDASFHSLAKCACLGARNSPVAHAI